MGDEGAHILYCTSFVQRKRYILGTFLGFDLSDQSKEIDE